MKYTEKIGNGYLTYEDKDLKKCAPSSFSELIFMWIGAILLCFILLGLFMGACGILGWLLELIF